MSRRLQETESIVQNYRKSRIYKKGRTFSFNSIDLLIDELWG